MKEEKRKLTFGPTIFRDWSIAYCELAYISATREFKKQYGWGYTDFIFQWDGKKETLYRAREEHIQGMFHFVKSEIEREPSFIDEVSSTLLADIFKYESLLHEWMSLDFKKVTSAHIAKIFLQLQESYIPLLPRFLIIMYFPQQVDIMLGGNNEIFKREYDICLETRQKVDKILAPLTEELLRKIGNYALQVIGVGGYDENGRFLALEEIQEILVGAQSNEWRVHLESEIAKRSRSFLFAGGEVKQIPLTTYLKLKGWELVEHEVVESVDFVRGTVAYKFTKHIQGMVKVVENKQELDKIVKGDIIVAPMTTPEYAPIFNKVSAIVTDEGGITCHAAIVARELKIPCIIGTKIATQVLHDGDLVEVDADNGVVRVLERAGEKAK